MKIEGKTYTLDFDDRNTLKIEGKLAAMPEEYEEIDEFFEKVIETVSETENGQGELILDLRELIFLNSSGIKTLCVSLVMEADEVELHMKILCSNSLDWQVEAIPTFKDLMENLEIIFE